jgi:hypothetical protein
MSQALLAGFLVAHGLITTAIGSGTITGADKPGVPGTSWTVWPTALGRSWVIDGLQLGTGASVAGGVLWGAAGLALLGAGFGLFGVPGLRAIWQPLAVAGGGVSLAALALYFHPIYAIGIAINLAILATQAGTRGPLAVPGA